MESTINTSETNPPKSENNLIKKEIQFYSISKFLRTGIYNNDFFIPPNFSNFIVLSTKGQIIEQKIKIIFNDAKDEDIKFSILLLLNLDKDLINTEKSELSSILSFFNKNLIEGRIKYPYIYDTLLFERYKSSFSDNIKTMDSDQTQSLLKDTPSGIFQIGHFLIGPFGLIQTNTKRFIPPIKKGYLWQCSDPGCQQLHEISFNSFKLPFISYYSEAYKHIKVDDYSQEYWSELDDEDCINDMSTYEFPFLLLNVFSENEIKAVVKYSFINFSKELRQQLPSGKPFDTFFSASAEQISKKISKSQALQILLLLSNKNLIYAIEYLVNEGTIFIPTTEKRAPKYPFWISTGYFTIRAELTRFGIRSYDADFPLGFLRLKRLIKALYKDDAQLKELSFLLRYEEGSTVLQKLENYLHKYDPKEIIQNLVFNQPENFNTTITSMEYGYFPIPKTKDDENFFIEKLLWKLGFDIHQYPQFLSLFWKRSNKFKEIVKNNPFNNEPNIEIVRSAGVNYFVSLEEILSHGLSFTCWVLLADHLNSTKFIYNYYYARSFMVEKLNGRVYRSTESVVFDLTGKNSLFPLIVGYSILADLCKEISIIPPPDICLKKENVSNLNGINDLLLFPFKHNMLFFDLNDDEKTIFYNLMYEITEIMENKKICNLRNLIDHKRDEFPTKKELLDAIDSIEKIVDKMEKLGIIPRLYNRNAMTIDQYDRSKARFSDYNGSVEDLYLPSNFLNIPGMPNIHDPIIFVSWIHIGNTLEKMRFGFEEESDYIDLYRNYPKQPRYSKE